MSFFSQIAARSTKINSLLCVGLDPHRKELGLEASASDEAVAAAAKTFCARIIEATAEYAVAYKPNSAFFECLGSEGHDTLLAVIKKIPKVRASSFERRALNEGC